MWIVCKKCNNKFEPCVKNNSKYKQNSKNNAKLSYLICPKCKTKNDSPFKDAKIFDLVMHVVTRYTSYKTNLNLRQVNKNFKQVTPFKKFACLNTFTCPQIKPTLRPNPIVNLGNGNIAYLNDGHQITIVNVNNGTTTTINRNLGFESGCLAYLFKDRNFAFANREIVNRLINNAKKLINNQHRNDISCLITLESGHIISGDFNGQISVWSSLDNRFVIGGKENKKAWISCVAKLCENFVVSGDANGRLMKWQIKPLYPKYEGCLLSKIDKKIDYLEVLSNGKIIIYGGDAGLWKYDTQSGKSIQITSKCIKSLAVNENRIAFMFTPQKTTKHKLCVYNIKKGTSTIVDDKVTMADEPALKHIAFLPNGIIVSGTASTSLKVYYDYDGLSLKLHDKGEKKPVIADTFTIVDDLIVAIGKGKLYVFGEKNYSKSLS